MAQPTSDNQKAIRIHGKRDIRIDDVPMPQIEHPDDAILKVELAGLCGSDLHVYRGSGAVITEPFVMGHEVYGEIVALGSSFSSTQHGKTLKGRPAGYTQYTIGMKQPFPSPASNARSPSLPGCQAQYVRIPKAGGTLLPITSLSSAGPSSNALPNTPPLPASQSILLADILPTGYYAAHQAFYHPNLAPLLNPSAMTSHIGLVDTDFAKDIVGVVSKNNGGTENRNEIVSGDSLVVKFAILGLGPVGLCAFISLVDLMLNLNSPRLRFKITAIDLLESRRSKAKEIIGRIDDRHFGSSIEVEFIPPEEAKPNTCHAILEVVGHPSSLLLASQLAAPFAIISSVGVHTNPTFPIHPTTLYDKNLAFAFGRCPVRALIPASKAILERRAKLFEGFVERVVPMGNEGVVKEVYEMFERGDCGKICFAPWE